MTYYTLWLVMLDGSDFVDMKYTERYRLFADSDSAIKWAKKNGYEDDDFGFGTKIGYLNHYACGGKEIGVISIEVEIP